MSHLGAVVAGMNPDEAVARMAADQHGIFTNRQARAAGMSPTMLATRRRRGLVVLVEPGVYRMAGAPVSWLQRAFAATLTELGVASHRTAAALWEFDGCQPGIIEVLTPRWRRRPNRSVRIHETGALPDGDTDQVGCVPVTSRERTLVDLAAVVPPARVELALDGVLTQHQTTAERVWECVERLDGRGRPWVAVTRRLVAARLGQPQVQPNTFEKALLRCLRDAGVPLPEPQVEIRDLDGSLIGRVDWLLRPKLVIECDSERWHGGWRQRQRDIRRDRRLVGLGYIVLRFSWDDVINHPEQVAADVVAALLALSA